MDDMINAAEMLVEEYERAVADYRETEADVYLEDILVIQRMFEANPHRYIKTRTDADGIVHYRVIRRY